MDISHYFFIWSVLKSPDNCPKTADFARLPLQNNFLLKKKIKLNFEQEWATLLRLNRLAFKIVYLRINQPGTAFIYMFL
jgi:hypothetical protein